MFDPVEKYIMVESRLGYFEANRHMLVAIQKLMTERSVQSPSLQIQSLNRLRFHLASHLVSLENEIEAPHFLQNNPVMDLSSLIDSESELERAAALCGAPREEDLLCNVDVLSEWPDITYSTLDHSQLRACQDIVSKRLAIIQGPPGYIHHLTYDQKLTCEQNWQNTCISYGFESNASFPEFRWH